LTKLAKVNILTKSLIEGFFLSKKERKIMAAADKNITLKCTACNQQNYRTTKNKKNTPDRIELKKFCKFCRAQTAHKEEK